MLPRGRERGRKYDRKEKAKKLRKTLAIQNSDRCHKSGSNGVRQRQNGKYTKVVRQMICSTGTDATPTLLALLPCLGIWAEWGYFAKFGVYAQYWSRIKGYFIPLGNIQET